MKQQAAVIGEPLAHPGVDLSEALVDARGEISDAPVDAVVQSTDRGGGRAVSWTERRELGDYTRGPGMTLYLAFAISGLAAAWLVSRYDLYDREPWPLTAAVIGAGAVAMAIAGPVEDRTIRFVSGGLPTAAHIASVAAAVEEGARFMIVLALIWLVPRHFNDPMDGLIYGSSAGIGMALEETTMYLARDAPAPLAGTLPVEIVRLFGHVIMGGITGFGIGMIHGHRAWRHWRAIAAACLVAGGTIHFLWDVVALTNAMHPGWEAQATAASLTLMVVSMGLYGGLVVAGSRSSRAVFAPGSPARLWRRGAP